MKKLLISSIAFALLFSSAETYAQIQIYNGSGGAIVPNVSASNINVGIGTSTPSGAALHLLTGTNPGMLPPAIKLDRNDGTNQAGLLTVGISGNGFGVGLGGGSAFFKLEDPYGNSVNSDMGFSTNGAEAQLVIKHSGIIGIGTSNPTGAALHLLTGTNPGMLPPAIKLDRNDGTNQAGLLTVGISGNGFGVGLGGGSAFFKLEDPYGNSANSDMGFSTNGAEAQLVIKHSGNVGVGISTPAAKLDVQNGAVRIGNVTTPAGYKLYVETGILTEKVTVAIKSSPLWADYVFDDDYKLRSIEEVAAFIEKNKHLPDLPSAEELVKSGLNVGEMLAAQMAKIEELTLYIIAMKNEIKAVKKKIQISYHQ